jgi:hypothetical protein
MACQLLPILRRHADGSPCKHQPGRWPQGQHCPGVILLTACSCGWTYRTDVDTVMYQQRTKHRQQSGDPRPQPGPKPTPASTPTLRQPRATHSAQGRLCTRDWRPPQGGSVAALIEAAPDELLCRVCESPRCARADGTVLWHRTVDHDGAPIECPGTDMPGLALPAPAGARRPRTAAA